MSVAVIHSRAQHGIEAPAVAVEVHLSNGLPGLSIVGLAEAAVRESKDRVRSAILNGGFEFPLRRITISLAPADLPKEGGRFDLPIALGILAASGQVSSDAIDDHEFIGELGLTGELRAVRGALPIGLATARAMRALVLPSANAEEAALVNDLRVLPAAHLLDVCAHLNGSLPLTRHDLHAADAPPAKAPDIADIIGQAHAKRALEVAASGGHNLLMIGPPGSGKTMLATRLPGILPAMTEQEAIESAAVASISHNGFDRRQWRQRPFRQPHHTASGVALVGGGSHPRPGEISLAHHGVLFLDELPEFDRQVLEVLREPLESATITISRAARQSCFPARVQLVAAMNPCPCGFLGDGSDRCRCTPERVRRYRSRISGPLLDRIDLQIDVPGGSHRLFDREAVRGESSAAVRVRVEAARDRQLDRRGHTNAALTTRDLEQDCALTARDEALLRHAAERLQLSMRAIHRVLRVARTIADLDGATVIETAHLTEALSYRRNDTAGP